MIWILHQIIFWFARKVLVTYPTKAKLSFQDPFVSSPRTSVLPLFSALGYKRPRKCGVMSSNNLGSYQNKMLDLILYLIKLFLLDLSYIGHTVLYYIDIGVQGRFGQLFCRFVYVSPNYHIHVEYRKRCLKIIFQNHQ